MFETVLAQSEGKDQSKWPCAGEPAPTEEPVCMTNLCTEYPKAGG